MSEGKKCPKCGTFVFFPKTPLVTVDIIIEMENGKILLIKRLNPPHGWALPGGFVDYGESLEKAALREAEEETSLKVVLQRQFHSYSDPKRDSRFHAATTVFVAKGEGKPRADSDAKEIGLFGRDELPEDIVFDHKEILEDYFTKRY